MPAEPTSTTELVTLLRTAGCVFAEDEADLLRSAARTPDELTGMVQRRTDGVPLEVILGWATFCDRRITVAPGVFVPRRRSEFLVHQARTLGRTGATVLDLCCGTGALGACVAAHLDNAELHATDIDPEAVRCAHHNIADLGGHAHTGDLYAPLPAHLRGHVDLLLVNAPYVPTDEIALMPPEARDHEPRRALDGGEHGVDVQRRAAADALTWLAPDGHLLIETSRQQAARTADLLTTNGLTPRVTRSDDHDATVVIATPPADTTPPR